MTAPMSSSYRRAEPADLDTVLVWLERYCVQEGHDFVAPKARASLSLLLADGRNGIAWLIEKSGRGIGCMVLTFRFSLSFGGRDAFVDEIHLEAPYRGRGIGARALPFMLTQARRHGVKAPHLEVDRGNARAHRLYVSLGFAPRGRFAPMSMAL